MTYSVDDLVASFSSGGHIGQEAIDIANLQDQLSQTLAYAHQHPSSSQGQGICNTPTARTPTTSFANWSVLDTQRRNRSRSASAGAGTGIRRGQSYGNLNEGAGSDMIVEESMDTDASEEYAVEQLLGATQQTSPVFCRGRGEFYTNSQAHPYTHGHPPPSPSQPRYAYANVGSDAMLECSPVSSSFATSDPFFAAAAAAEAQSHSFAQTGQSFFAHIGRPAQHSPFFAATANATNTGPSASQQGHFVHA